MERSHQGTRWVAALLAAACLAAAWNAARLGLSGHQSQAAHSAFEKGRPTRAQLDRIEADLHESLAHRQNPAALNLLGTVSLVRGRTATEGAVAVRHAVQARELFRSGLQQLPTSPFLWANLALAGMYLGAADHEIVRALMNADRLGPWEPAIQRTVVFVGLASWPRLGIETRAAVEQAVFRAGRYNADAMAHTLRSFGRLDLACGQAHYRNLKAECAKIQTIPAKS